MQTFHNDGVRDGVYGAESALTPSSITTGGSFKLLKNYDSLDGLVYAQPLYIQNVSMATSTGCSSPTDIVIVATLNNSIYAYEVKPGSSTRWRNCWKASLTGTNEYPIPFTALSGSCSNIVPQQGITGTPVVDTSVTPAAVYAVGAVTTPGGGYDFKLGVMKIDSGAQASGSPLYLSAAIQGQSGGSGFLAINENQRAGLAYFRPTTGNAANIYVAFGSHCDTTPFSGYVAGFQYPYATHSWVNLGVFNTQPPATQSFTPRGGIWMGGAAPAVDANGNLYLSVGNGTQNVTAGASAVPTGLGESVVQLHQSGSSLAAVDYYTPNDHAFLDNGSGTNNVCAVNSSGTCPTADTFQLTSNDYDYGSAGVTLVQPTITGGALLCDTGSTAGFGELVSGGKEGVLYGLCYNPANSGFTSTQRGMGGLDSCGYSPSAACLAGLNGVAANTACTQANIPPGGGNAIAQCWYGVQNLGGQATGAPTGSRSTPVFWAGTTSATANYLFLAGTGLPLTGFRLSASGQFPANGVTETVPHTYPYPGSTPSLSWNPSGSQPLSSAVVWATDSGHYGQYNPTTDTTSASGAATLFGYTADYETSSILANDFRSDKITWPTGVNPGPGAVKFTVPTIAGGMAFVAGGAANPTYYAPGRVTTSGANCTPTTASGGSCSGGLYIFGIN